jgi:hypothetical protein
MELFHWCQALHQRNNSFDLMSSLHWFKKTRTQLDPVEHNLLSGGKHQTSFKRCLKAPAFGQTNMAWWAISGSIPQILQVGITSCFSYTSVLGHLGYPLQASRQKLWFFGAHLHSKWFSKGLSSHLGYCWLILDCPSTKSPCLACKHSLLRTRRFFHGAKQWNLLHQPRGF